jgi:hypothetical protein
MNKIFGWVLFASMGLTERRSNEVHQHNFLRALKAQIVANTEHFMITFSACPVLRESTVILVVSIALSQSLIFLRLTGELMSRARVTVPESGGSRIEHE